MLFFYRAAWQKDYRKDIGYGGVNAAFVMDLLARETGRVKGRVGDVALLRFISGWFGGSLLLIAAIAIVWVCWDIPIFQGQVTVGQLIAAFLVVLATATVPVLRLLKPRKVGRRVGEGLAGDNRC